MDNEEIQDARIDHAYAMGALAGLNAATFPCIRNLGAVRCEDGPNNRKAFEGMIERMQRESRRVIVRHLKEQREVNHENHQLRSDEVQT